MALKTSPLTGAVVEVIDTETRHLTGEEAYRKVSALAEAARRGNPRLIYKKTDSTLRGNIGSELAALVDVFAAPLMYAPAYPAMGRTVKGGRLYVNGIPVSETAFARDPLNPIRDDSIRRLIGDCGQVEILDGETDEDLRRAADVLLAREGIKLAAGPAGFAQFIAERIDLPREAVVELPAIRTCLVVNGSLHEVSLAQVRHAEAHGWVSAALGDVAGALRSSGWVILRADETMTGAGLARARNLGRAVREILDHVDVDALIVFGGDTAAGILDALGSPPLYPVREVMSGIPVSRLRHLCLVTKAGGFGGVDVLPKLRILLRKER